MKPRIRLPKDESIHRNYDGEWWYFNGFLEGKHRYAFMHCLFRMRGEKIKLPLLTLPIKELFFSHSILFDLTKRRIYRETLPVVIPSEDSFQKKDLFINYHYLFQKDLADYEIARRENILRIKNRFLDLSCTQTKSPLLEGGTGFVDLGKKKTYYYSYTNMKAVGYVGKDRVRGKVWHDRQWFNLNSAGDDAWVWFSIQMADNTELVCANYKGRKYAYLLHPDNRQESCRVKFTPAGKVWKSPVSGLIYELEWEISIKNYTVRTRPIIKECEVNFGVVNYWEGPLEVLVNGKRERGFMECVLPNQPTLINLSLKVGEQDLFRWIKKFKSRRLR
jgi:predicted secreted hydrolase